MGHVGNQQPGQRGDRHVDQEAHRHVVGLEVNPDHGPQFEIDEQQENVIDLDMTDLDHLQELHHRRPRSDRADGEQRQIVERLDKQIAQGLGQLMNVLPQVLGPIDFHDGSSLGRFDRMMRVGRDGCSACRKKARAPTLR